MNPAARTPEGALDESDHISATAFRALTALIHAEAGISLQASKQTMLEGRLRRRARALGIALLEDYCAFVLAEDSRHEELEHLINAVTTNKTDFFREPGHFKYIAETILPAMRAEGRTSLRCWSAGCSTGAEAYTLAMLLEDNLREHGGPDYRILATDLDTQVLQTARAGIFPREMVAPVPAALRRQFVMDSLDPRRGEVRIVPELRQRIGFARLNLIDRQYPVGEPLDLVFCRNVLIYFDRDTQEAVVNRLTDRLVPGGHLFLGHSESINGFNHALTTVAGTVFRKDQQR